MFKKAWSDPVWSKVIAAIIIGLGTLVYTKVVSVTEHLTFKQSCDKLLETKVSVVYVLAAIIAYLFLTKLFRKRSKKNRSFHTPKQQELRKFNSSADSQEGLLYRWGVYFDHDTPFIAELTVFCTRHGEPPIRFMGL